MSHISELSKRISDDIISSLKNELNYISNYVFQSSLKNIDSGYCMKFIIPVEKVLNLSKLINIPINEISDAFIADWNLPRNDHKMYGEPYYHILLLLFYYGVVNRQEVMSKQCLSLILYRMWNGRLTNAIKYCDAKTMAYVVRNMLNKRHLVLTYNSPLTLINDYFVPTLFSKYADMVRRDPKNNLKLLFNQCFNRLRQIFYQNMSVDLTNPSAPSTAKSGLAVLYYKAKYEGTNIETKTPLDNEEAGIEDKLTSSEFNDMVDTITSNIVMNKYDLNSYSAPLIELIKSDHKLSTQGIEKIINKLHSPSNMDNIRDIISILLYLVSKNNISCTNEQQYYESIKKLVISSKNTTINKQVKILLDKLLTSILNQYNMNYDAYTDVRKSQFRAAVIYLLSEILYKHICVISHNI